MMSLYNITSLSLRKKIANVDHRNRVGLTLARSIRLHICKEIYMLQSGSITHN